jgi:hypothetical protein
MVDSVIRWREVVDTPDGRDEMILKNWQQLAASAWAGYLEEGRGALLLDLRSAANAGTHPGVTVECTYLALDSLTAAAHQSESDPEVIQEQLDRLSNYDPSREMVLFILSGDGNCVRSRCIHSESEQFLNPPEAYRLRRSREMTRLCFREMAH